MRTRCLFLTFCVRDVCTAHSADKCVTVVCVSADCRWCGGLGLCGQRKQAVPHPGRGASGSSCSRRDEGKRDRAGRSYCCEFMHQISWYCAEEIPTEAELGLCCCLYHNTLLRNWCWFQQRHLKKFLLPVSCPDLQVRQFVVSVNGLNVLDLDYRIVSYLILTGPRTVVMEVMEEAENWD